MQYPELDYIMKITENNGKLYVFGKDYDRDAIRIYIHNLQSLNASGVAVGTVSEIQSRIETLRQQRSLQDESQPSPGNHAVSSHGEKIGGSLR